MQYRVLLAAVAVLALSWNARAATLHVPAEHPTIQAGIDAAADGDSVLVAPGLYQGAGNKQIQLRGLDLVLLGTGGSAQTTIDCEHTQRGFYIQGSEPSTCLIQGFTVRNGERGGLLLNHSSPTLRDIVVEDCSSLGRGGAIFLIASNSLAEDLVLRGNQAPEGGAIACESGTHLTLRRAILSGNNAGNDGGGIYCEASTLVLEAVTVADNSCGDEGGALSAWASSTLEFSTCIFAFNTSVSAGLDLHDSLSQLSLSCCDVYGNAGGNYGGYLVDPAGADGNLSADPEFCDPSREDYRLNASSPCLPENNACSAQMGLMGQGCDELRFTLSGHCRESAGAPQVGVMLLGLPFELLSDSSGGYSLSVPQGWSGTLTPYKHGYDFEPLSRSYSQVNEDWLDQDFQVSRDFVREVPGEYATIQAAVDASISGDTVLLAPGTYVGTGNTEVLIEGKSIVLTSSAGAAKTTIDCNYKSQGIGFFDVPSPGGALSGISLVHAKVNGCALTLHSADTVVEDMRISLNDGQGASVTYGSPVFRRVEFSTNQNMALNILYSYNAQGSTRIENCAFISNHGDLGGALACDGVVYISDCTFLNNTAFRYGGACYFAGDAWGVFSDTSFEQNRTQLWNGGACYFSNSNGVFENVSFRNNVAYFKGGGLACAGSTLSLGNALFLGNVAIDGGAIQLEHAAPASILNTTIVANSSSYWGGQVAVYYADAQVTIDSSLIAFAPAGVGVLSEYGASIQLGCCDVYGNAGGNYAGMADPTGEDGNISQDPRFCDVEAEDFTLDSTSPCLPANNACGVQMGSEGEGCTATAVADSTPTYRLQLSGVPNPFNPATVLAFQLPGPATVSLRIYDVDGRRVATLIDAAPYAAGQHAISWNGRDDGGRPSASGVYFARLSAGSVSIQSKLVLLR